MDLTHITPTPNNYDEYCNQRNERTKVAMASMNSISGSYCKAHNLSVRLLFDAGYVFDANTDSMVKESHGKEE
jgi:hypothetical protein